MKNRDQLLTMVLILVLSLLFSSFAWTNTIPPQPIKVDLSITGIRLMQNVELQYRYVNRILKYVVVKNSGNPIEIKIFNQGRVLGVGDTFVLMPPQGVASMQLEIRDYSAKPNLSMFNFSNKLATRTYMLFLPEYSERQKSLFVIEPI